MTARDTYVVIVYDAYDETSISFVLGPYPNLAEAQEAWRRAVEDMRPGYRPHSIQKCREANNLPEWERHV